MSVVGSPAGADAVVSEEKVHYSKRSRDEDRSGEGRRIMEPRMEEKKGKATGGIYHGESEKDTTEESVQGRKG